MFSWTIVSPSCPIVPSSHRPTVLIIIPLCLSSIPIPSAHSHFHLRFGCVTWPSRILVTAFTLIKAKNVGLYTGSFRPDPVHQRHNSIFGHQFNCDGVCWHTSYRFLPPLPPPPLLPSFKAFERLLRSAPGWDRGRGRARPVCTVPQADAEHRQRSP